MNATITYTLTEQAQRAQMATTGQPVARKQVVTEEFPADLLGISWLVKVTADGAVSVDLSEWTHIAKDGTVGGCGNWTVVGGEIVAIPESGVQAIRDRIAAVEAKRSEVLESARMEAERAREDSETKAREKAAKIAIAQPAIEAYLQSKWPALAIDTGHPFWIAITATDPAQSTALPAHNFPTGVLIHRDLFGDKVVTALAAVHTCNAETMKAEKAAREAEKEALKLDFICGWIAEHGNDSQKARSDEGLLCRDEAIRALADATFSAVNGTAYSADSRPLPDCNCDDCHDDCEIRYEVRDSADCLNEVEYERLARIKASFVSHDLIKFVLRTRTAVHDCDHSPKCVAGERHTCMVKATVGPFTLQREYAI